MTDHSVIAILVGILAALAAVIGYGLGEWHRHRDETSTYIRQLQEHERRLQAQDALIHIIAEEYDPTPEQTEQRKRRKLPEGWAVIEGEGALAIIAVLWAKLREHRRSIGMAVIAAGAASLAGVALLAHGAPPPQNDATGPTPHSSSALHSSAPSAARTHPTTKPGHTPLPSLPPAPLVPVRRRAPQPAPSPVRSTPLPPPPRPTPSPTPPPRPSPSPSQTCLLRVTLHGILDVCL